MGMCGCFRTASDAEIRALLERPERICRVFGMPEPVKGPGLLARLFGRKPAEPLQPVDAWIPEEGNEDFDVDKAWHGIHFLLCGDAGDGVPPLNFMAAGGELVGTVDVGYGPARACTSGQVAEIAEAMEQTDVESLRARCDPERFKAEDIYPSIWDEPGGECFEYVLNYFEDLREFMKKTRDEGKGLLVYLA